MGARGKGGGVEPRARTIRLRFRWNGKRCYEVLDLPPTGPNLKAAQRMMDTITAEIAAGVFVYARHFPDSVTGPTEASTYKDFADQWVKTLTASHGTVKGYESSLNKVWIPALGAKRLAEIRHTDIKAVVAARGKAVSGKTVNNDLIPLRAVFEAAVSDELLTKSPALEIDNLPHQSPLPDPFTMDEVAMILADMRKRSPIEVWAYYQFAFATGIRPSEQIIARWSKLNRAEETLRIDTARTRNREKGTKTSTVRDIDLTGGALAALAEMKPLTFLAEADAPIFCHPATRRPWTNDQYQRVTYFHPTLKRLGIRKRDAYQTRHTYATTGLMLGANPAYMARQMGHTDPTMFFTKYAKWLDGADKGREKAKLQGAWAQSWPSKETGH